MIKPDRAPFCSWTQIGVFWKYWIVGGAIYIYERILREVRARHRTYISKVIQHPSRVVEIQIKKENTTVSMHPLWSTRSSFGLIIVACARQTRAGQYIFLNCPEISYWQWHRRYPILKLTASVMLTGKE
jgi:hypothetical protein